MWPLRARQHAVERQARAGHHAEHVDLDLAPRDGRVLLRERADGHDPGVVDQHVERAQLALGLVEERGEAVGVGHVGGVAGVGAGAGQRGGLDAGQVAVQVGDGDAAAARRRWPSRLPDPGRGRLR